MNDNTNESIAVKTHQPCLKCGGSDPATLYSDGHVYCFSCESSYFVDDNGNVIEASKKAGLWGGEYYSVDDRMIDDDTCRRFSYRLDEWNGKEVHIADFHDANGNVIGQKVRYVDSKEFRVNKKLGSVSSLLFGKAACSQDRTSLVITEGEIDAMTIAQEIPAVNVVSLPQGVGSVRTALKANMDWIKGFKEVTLCLDMDAPGKKACEEAKQLLEGITVKIAELPMKDANEMLLAGKGPELVEAIMTAKVEDETKAVWCDFFDGIENEMREEPSPGISSGWEKLDQMTSGFERGGLVVIQAESGVGKSTMIREMMLHMVIKEKLYVAAMMLEENVRTTKLAMLSIMCGRNLRKYDPNLTGEELVNVKMAAVNQLQREGIKLDLYSSKLKDTPSLDDMCDRVKDAIEKGAEVIYVDNLNAAASLTAASDQKEHERLKALAAMLAKIAEDENVVIIMVAHTNTESDKGRATKGTVSGSKGIVRSASTLLGFNELRNEVTLDLMTSRAKKKIFDYRTVEVLKHRLDTRPKTLLLMRFNRDVWRLEDVALLDSKEQLIGEEELYAQKQATKAKDKAKQKANKKRESEPDIFLEDPKDKGDTDSEF